MIDLEFIVISGPDAGHRYAFPSATFLVGSADDVGLRVVGHEVQPRHLEVSLDPMGVVWVRDLTGQGQVWIDREQLERGSVQPGGIVRVGLLELGLRVASTGQRAVARATDVGAVGAVTSAGALRAGEIIDGRYEVLSKLAVGGMGEVYRAQHAQLGKPVVLKVMKASLSEDPDIVARFKREAIAASRIGHQNIVDVSDFGRAPDGRFYFVMEYLEGVTLKRLLAQEGAQPLGRVVHLGLQIARALAAAHEQTIVHRDLKPENLMVLQRVGAPDFVKVLDFGVAKVAATPGEGGQTAFGMVMGTPGYMSPEQAQGVPVDARSDLYSLGLILYELLAGKPTFTAETPSLLMFKQIGEPPPPFAPEVAATVPTELEALIFRMLQKAPGDRPASMNEVIAVLERTPAGPAPRPRPLAPVTTVDLNAPTVALKATPAPVAPPGLSASRAPGAASFEPGSGAGAGGRRRRGGAGRGRPAGQHARTGSRRSYARGHHRPRAACHSSADSHSGSGSARRARARAHRGTDAGRSGRSARVDHAHPGRRRPAGRGLRGRRAAGRDPAAAASRAGLGGHPDLQGGGLFAPDPQGSLRVRADHDPDTGAQGRAGARRTGHREGELLDHRPQEEPLRPMNVFAALSLASALLAAAPAPVPSPATPEVKRARELYQSAAALYAEGKYAQALARFEETLAVRPHPSIHYNLGRCHEQLGDLPQALRSYRTYLSMSPDAKDRDSVIESIAGIERTLRNKGLQVVSIDTPVPGAMVHIDDAELGPTPAIAALPFGSHRVRVSAEGFDDFDKAVLLQPSQTIELTVTLVRTAPRPVAPPLPPPMVDAPKVEVVPEVTPVTRAAPPEAVSVVKAPPQDKPTPVWAIVVGSVAVASAGAAGGMLAGSYGAANTLATVDPNRKPSDVDALVAQGRTLGTGSQIAWAVAGTAAVTAVILLVVGK